MCGGGGRGGNFMTGAAFNLNVGGALPSPKVMLDLPLLSALATSSHVNYVIVGYKVRSSGDVPVAGYH